MRTSEAEVYCRRQVPSNLLRSIGSPKFVPSTFTWQQNQTNTMKN
ncbi:hypothetical protein A2U01_0115447, partial [Trifolium medium]|nr:hypothetical protein [Trifolium medium]